MQCEILCHDTANFCAVVSNHLHIGCWENWGEENGYKTEWIDDQIGQVSSNSWEGEHYDWESWPWQEYIFQVTPETL